MVHEVNDQNDFFDQLLSNLSPGGKVLIAEPKFHVSAEDFEKTVKVARSAGLKICGQPPIRFSHAALLEPD
jgi:hypothetical protein